MLIVGELDRATFGCSRSYAFANAKSTTLTLPFGVSLMFDGCKSR